MMRIEEHEFIKTAETISNPNPGMRIMPMAIPSEYGFSETEDEKTKGTGFHIGALPAALIGAVIGSAITKKHTERPLISPPTGNIRPPRQPMKTGYGDKSYYDQMTHLSDNLRVIFTPVSVVYLVKDGLKEVPLETIEVEEMNDEMHKEWQDKNHDYFKNLLLNKMRSDIQFAERAFAKKVLERQMGIAQEINKDASVSEIDFEDMTDVELFHYAAITDDFFEKDNPIIEKVADFVVGDVCEDNTMYIIAEAYLDRPFDKYAGAVADVASLFPFNKKDGNVKSSQGKYLNPIFLTNNVKVGFFPDRVIFIVDGKLVSTLKATSMDEECFEHFGQKDLGFFQDYFKKRVRIGTARLNDRYPSNDPAEKTASVEKITMEDIFYKNDIHPAVYFLLLTAKYGAEWIEFDNAALIQIIEKDFALTRPISDIPLNKIFCVKTLNASTTSFTSRHVFEKIIRSFNNKPIDFMTRENTDLDLEDFVFGLDAMNRVTPNDNIYDNFSPEVYDYIVKTLADHDNYIWGVNVTGSPEEEQFITILNYSLLSELNNRFTASISNNAEKDDIIKENELIFNTSLRLIDAVMEQQEKTPELNIGEYLRSAFKNAKIDQDIVEIIIRKVVKNVVLDAALDEKEQTLMQQLIDLKLHNE
jgi:hypothetical protein